MDERDAKALPAATSNLADEAAGISRESAMERRDRVFGRERLQELHFAIPGQALQAVRAAQIALAIDVNRRTRWDRAAFRREKEGIVVLDLDERVPMALPQHVEHGERLAVKVVLRPRVIRPIRHREPDGRRDRLVDLRADQAGP